MADKFQNKHRIASHRKPGWDYSSDGHYFITLVVQTRHNLLGHIENGNMILNPWGEIVFVEWKKSFAMRSELFCDTFVIMPNHLHAILTIDNNRTTQRTVETHGRASLQTDHDNIEETHGRASLPPCNDNTTTDHDNTMQTHGRASLPDTNIPKTWERKPKSISSFMAGFKSATNSAIDNAIDGGLDLFPHLKKFNRNNHFWQPNYYDHIIRNSESYYRISDYIDNNPLNWEMDKLFENEK